MASAQAIRIPLREDAELLVCRPSLDVLVAHGWNPTPLLNAVLAALPDAEEIDEPRWVIEDDDEQLERKPFLEAWVCACGLAPRIVAERELVDAAAIHVEDVPFLTKRAIYVATYSPMVQAALRGAAPYMEYITARMRVMPLDGTSRRYGCRPSEVLAIRDPLVALDFDMAVAVRAAATEREQMERRTKVH